LKERSFKLIHQEKGLSQKVLLFLNISLETVLLRQNIQMWRRG